MKQHRYDKLTTLEENFGVLFVKDEKANILRIDHLGSAELSKFILAILAFAQNNKLNKVTAKVSNAQALYFYQYGFVVEASIPAYFGMQDALFVARYFDYDEPCINEEQEKILEIALEKCTNELCLKDLNEIVCCQCESSSKQAISIANSVSFCGVKKPQNINTQTHQSLTFVAKEDEKVIAKAECQFNKEDKAVEFSDFVVNKKYEPTKLVSKMLAKMESYFASVGCQTAYTIVSSESLTINAICAENQYDFGGTLKHESTIKETAANFNTWFKRL